MVIVGQGNAVTRVAYNTATRAAGFQDYEPTVGVDIKGATRINTLAVVVRTLEQLAEKDLTTESEPTVFYTLNQVTDFVHNGTFKFWLLNGGKKQGGEDVTEVEIGLWTRFAELYSQMYNHIIFKDVSSVNVPKNPRFTVSMDIKILAEFVDKSWERVRKNMATEVSVAEGEDI